MDSNIPEIEAIFIPEGATNSNLFQVEQTEPLNLCLNGGILKGFVMAENHPNLEESGIFDEESDDDVIFVKEYKVNKAKTAKRLNGRKMNIKGTPRRNPVRQARVTKRFKEYTDESFDEEEFFEDTEDGEFVEVTAKFSTKNEDCEDWKVEDLLKKNRQRKRQVGKRNPYHHCRLGRKRKFNNVIKNEERKVLLKELDPLLKSNLLLIKDYVEAVKDINNLLKEEENECVKSERTKNAQDVLKQQVILIAIARDIIDGDVLKRLLE